jgi:hypothetical protein
MATEIIGGSALAMPHAPTARKFGLFSTFAPTKTMGKG